MKYLILLILILNLHAQNILGKIDKFDLPDLGVYNIKAKIDTGAKTSSLHCSDMIQVGDSLVRFIVLDNKNNNLTDEYITKPISRISYVKSSNGKSEKRYFIKTRIIIYNKIYDMELSLSNRDSMIYPLLIGRELLDKGFIIDTTKKYLSFKEKK